MNPLIGLWGKRSLAVLMMLSGVMFFAGIGVGYNADTAAEAHVSLEELDLPEAGETYEKDNPVYPNEYEQNTVTTSAWSARLVRALAKPPVFAFNLGSSISYTWLSGLPSTLVAAIAKGGAYGTIFAGVAWHLLHVRKLVRGIA